jgi:hypothetical protein
LFGVPLSSLTEIRKSDFITPWKAKTLQKSGVHGGLHGLCIIIARRRWIKKPMNTKIDIKSAMLGLVFGILVTLVVAAASSPGPVGRYQIAGTAAHGLVLDTATGQAWSAFLPTAQGKTDADFYQPKLGEKK